MLPWPRPNAPYPARYIFRTLVSFDASLSVAHFDSQIFDPIENPWKMMLRIIVASVKANPMLLR